jgi:hypothetical protein
MIRRTVTAEESPNDFTPRAQQVLALARKEADRLNHNFLGTLHLLLGIITLGQGKAVNVLKKMGLDLEIVRQEVEKRVGTGPDQKMVGSIPYSPRVKKVIALAQKEAKQLNHARVGTEHLLLGLLQEGDGVAVKVLASFGVELEKTRNAILRDAKPNHTPEAARSQTASGTGEPKTTGDTQTEWSQGWWSRVPKPEPVDLSRRYDVYCIQHGEAVIYRNVLLKSAKGLFASHGDDESSLYLELEQPDGKAIYLPKHSVFKFCDPGATAGGEPVRKRVKSGKNCVPPENGVTGPGPNVSE